jgi:hypothetical protein
MQAGRHHKELTIMARTARKSPTPRETGTKHQPTRAATAPTKAPAKSARGSTAGKRAPATPVPKPSKEELIAQVEKLEHANATLRAKQREAGRAARTSGARIAELEAQVRELEARVASLTPAPKRPRTRRPREIDPGDSVPEGVAVLEPQPMDTEAETALENLEQHLRQK